MYGKLDLWQALKSFLSHIGGSRTPVLSYLWAEKYLTTIKSQQIALNILQNGNLMQQNVGFNILGEKD